MTTIQKIMPIEVCGNVSSCQSSPSGYAAYMTGHSRAATESPKAVASHALRQLEAARAKDVAAHEKNLPAIENNKVIRMRITALMDEIGMPKRWSERDLKSRSSYPKTIGHDAGYITDLAREVRIDDSFDNATATYERLLKAYNDYSARAEKEAAEAQAKRDGEAAVALEKRKADMELATILLRYSLPIVSTWEDVLEALCAKHQRLDLAVAMRQTRGDWSDGPYRVRHALDRFQIETTEDKDIANDILECLEDFEDGRVFRDTKWSYDALFASVPDQQLVADVQAALGHSE